MEIEKRINKYLNEMMSHTTINKFSSDVEILREAIMAEYDATNLYEQMARQVRNTKVKRVLEHVAFEEKEHIEEFKELLEELDPSIEKAEEKAEEKLKNQYKMEK